MSISRTSGSGGASQPALDSGEIFTPGPPLSLPNLSASQLIEVERKVSINLAGRWAGRGVEVLTTLLGLPLTAGSVAWSGDPVPKMRALQKKFLEHGMACEGAQRERALAAISVVEKNIHLRLRLHQLHMSDLQLASDREVSTS
ncbi:hypothetical protein QN362_13685 [Actimicrobium sp. CCC2.4]|uniref:hypothetical protein n=1 Tax=Actimicrobium sp. CCC2.4 TaxID=3048606 RepID=UPI002AC9565C|nr:hypothetical protein [Actimicrobium sp. CCC2.4]MEB0136389.1 hypothetical protein [Actimicrobium sp. CCC2.4]WPX31208.1 hypothetical protein RHM62_13240 [Actimicrobium sp. CCC2.4]